MTPTPLADAVELADKIDPRKPHVVCHTKGINEAADLMLVERWDLIAASDLLRTLSPIKDEEIAGLVRRLRAVRVEGVKFSDTFNDTIGSSKAEIYEYTPDACIEAADLIESLHTRALLARRMAIEECARWHDRLAENYDGKDATDEYNKLRIMHRQSADALRSLSPTLDLDALEEKLARIMWIDTSDKDYWDHVEDSTRNIYRSNARAVIATLVGK